MKSFGRKKLSGKPYILLTDLKYYAEEFQAFRIISREFNIFGIVFSSAQSVLYRIRYNSDRGSQYTSDLYREELQNCGIIQSMNSDGGRCHDNARCEAMWARMKEELLYGRYDTKQMTMEELKTLIWRYYMIYWNTRRICSANGGLPPMVKRKQYYDTLGQVA